jgi:DNA polymerase III delta prime subunit
MRVLEKDKVTPLLKGRIEIANYKEQELREYTDNPFIEALPHIFSEDDVLEQFTRYPIVDDVEKSKDKNLRHHMIKRIKNFIQPLPDHFIIESKLSTLIRRGYLARNPLDKTYFERLRILDDIHSTKQEERADILNRNMEHIRSTADSLSIIGISGIGKTTTIERLLLMYPQIIKHEEYRGISLSRTQIVWLKIDCPYDGNLATLCKNFFKTIDDLLGTRYLEKYGYLNRITSSMMIHMTSLASMYGIGVLVIDEIQHLINSKNDPDEMLNFFVTLTNTVGIPTVLIGTFKALRIFKRDFRQARRAGSEGNIIWDRMTKDSDEWDFFIETLWEFQWLKNEAELTQEMKDYFYDKCQGITSIAVNLFILAQERALNTANEKITKQIISKTSKEDLYMVHPMIKALRNNNRTEIMKYEDISINLDDITFKHKNSLQIAGKIKEMAKNEERLFELKRNNIVENLIVDINSLGIFEELTENEIENLVNKVVNKYGIDDDYNTIKLDTIKRALQMNDKKNEDKTKNNSLLYEEKDLRNLYELSKKKKVHVYEILKEKGYIKNSIEEFLKVE